MQPFLTDFWRDVWTVFGVAGTAATLVGLWVAVVQIRRTATAAEAARVAAEDVRRVVQQRDALAAFSAAVAMMDEIKRLHRVGAWAVLPERYSAVTRVLLDLRESNVALSPDQQDALLGAIDTLHEIEQRIETYLASPRVGKRPPRVPPLNRAVSKERERLVMLLAALRANIER